MAKPNSRQELIDYCLRKLGSPVVNVNVATEQLDDRIDEALETYHEKHYDGGQEKWLSYTITQTDLDNGYVTLPDNVHNVLDIINTSGMFASSNLFDYKYQIAINSLSPWDPFDSVDYYMKMTNYYSTMDLTDNDVRISFSKHGRRLNIYDENLAAGQRIGLLIYQLLDPEEITDVFNDKWLKQYATALIKRQWGENMSKFSGVQMLGGVELNGQTIREQAVLEIEKLEEELQETYMTPTDFLIG